jgi:hypothetical protein
MPSGTTRQLGFIFLLLINSFYLHAYIILVAFFIERISNINVGVFVWKKPILNQYLAQQNRWKLWAKIIDIFGLEREQVAKTATIVPPAWSPLTSCSRTELKCISFSFSSKFLSTQLKPRPDFGGNSGGGGKNLGEVQRSNSRPSWKVRA